MIAPENLFDTLKRHGVGLFAGVPDSLLASFCAYVDCQSSREEHIITANEGNAVALAAGYYLSSGKIAAVYMQNSGLGNAINPLTSLADPEVCGIPLVMIIGWRGVPGVQDEPQHIKQGRITPAQLDLLGIPYWELEANSDLDAVVAELFETLDGSTGPVALLVRKGTFSKFEGHRSRVATSKLKREAVLRQILALADPDDLIVSTTGKTSREVFELRAERNEAQRDFLTVGAMGHTASIALGVALGNPHKRVICLDGDGSVLMHLGALAIIGDIKPPNLVHVLLNNSAHESVGGQPTVAGNFDFSALAQASRYAHYRVAATSKSLTTHWSDLAKKDGPSLLEVKISKGSRDDLGRPTNTPEENKCSFMEVARG